MPFNFTNETLFTGAFILIIVLFIQYMVYLRLKKLIKLELSKKAVNITKEREKEKPTQVVSHNQDKNKDNYKKEDDDDETYGIDTPEDDADSYVNPIHSEKNIDDDIDDE